MSDLTKEKIEDMTNDDKSLIELENQSTHLVIENEEGFNKATELLKAAKFRIKQIEAQRKKYTDPLRETIDALIADFKPYKERAELVKSTLEKAILTFNKEREDKLKKEAEAKRQADVKKLQEEAERNKELNEVFGDKSKAIMADIQVKQAERLESKELKIDTTVRTSGGTTSIRKIWTYEIIDADNVPVDYCTPDHKKIMEAINNGKREIAGLRIYEKPSLISR